MSGEPLHIRTMDAAAAGDGTPVLVLLHGRGADNDDLAGLRGWLPDALTLVLPRAPFPGAPWGYGAGWAWYRYMGEDRPEPESFAAAQQALDDLVDGLAGRLGYTPGGVVMGGFSQGGTMSVGNALRRPGTLAGVVNLSGFVPSHPDVPVTADTVGDTPFFWGHGTHDPAIPFHMARRGRQALLDAGADLEAHDYAVGHQIAQEEVRHLADWLGRIL